MSTFRLHNESARHEQATVLLVDDDPGIRVLAEKILEAHGYRVLSCHDAAEALRIFAAVRVDLLLTDISIPGLSGLELAEELRARNPSLRVLLISGDEEAAIGACSGNPDMEFLCKPFRVDELVERVARSLGLS
ncbi:MAG: response regulator [Thermoanaerobaculia bacterium]